MNEAYNSDENLFGVPEDQQCNDVIVFLKRKNICMHLTGNGSKDLFCKVFDACKEEASERPDRKDGGSDDELDCDALTECDWPGIKKEFIGDGVCDFFTGKGTNKHNCYNHKICNYDGGDCCEDKCTDGDSIWARCGSGDGFHCADPASSKCDPNYVREKDGGCPDAPTPAPTPEPTCADDESMYKLSQYDSWNDGWNKALMTITTSLNFGEQKTTYSGSLERGGEGHKMMCMKNGCYSVKVTSGDWGNDISWEIHPAEGGSLLASGGAPSTCHFSVGGDFCGEENSCLGEHPVPPPLPDPDVAPSPDDDYYYNDDDDSGGNNQAKQLRCIGQSCHIESAACLQVSATHASSCL